MSNNNRIRAPKKSANKSQPAGRPSLRSAPGSNLNLQSSKHVSRLQLMSSTGFSQKHEMSLFNRTMRFLRLPHFSEYIMSVDHHQIWRRHLAWSLRDGDNLRNAVTSRFASNMVFMSLLLGTEIGVLFSPSKPADKFRMALKNESYGDLNFWAAIILCVSIGLTLSTLVANFTAWAIIGAVSPHNAHAVLRSSVGLDAAQLPARLVILSIYFFVAWIMMFIFILAPPIWGYFIVLFPVVFIWYIVVFYSSVGRLVIYSRAMQQREVFKEEEENSLSSKRLTEELLKRAEKEKKKNSPLPLVYRTRRELSEKLSDLRIKEQEDFVDMGFGSTHASHYVKQILDSSGHREGSVPSMDELLGYPDENDIEHGNGDTPQNPMDPNDSEGPFQSSYPPGDPSALKGQPSNIRMGKSRRDSFTEMESHGKHDSSRAIFHDNSPQQIALTL